jgi:hypothetical protein
MGIIVCPISVQSYKKYSQTHGQLKHASNIIQSCTKSLSKIRTHANKYSLLWLHIHALYVPYVHKDMELQPLKTSTNQIKKLFSIAEHPDVEWVTYCDCN